MATRKHTTRLAEYLLKQPPNYRPILALTTVFFDDRADRREHKAIIKPEAANYLPAGLPLADSSVHPFCYSAQLLKTQGRNQLDRESFTDSPLSVFV